MVEFCAQKADNRNMKRDGETLAGKGRGWMRLAAAASALGVSEHTVRRWADAGVVPSYRSPGGQRRFRRADVERQLSASAGGVAGAGRSGRQRPAAEPPRGRDAWLRSLLDASRAVATAPTLEEALRMVAQFAAEALGSPECVILEYDSSRDAIIPRALYESAPTGWDRLGELLPLDEYPLERRILESGESLEERLSDTDLAPASRAALEAWGDKMCLSVPLRVRGASKGILEVFENERDRHFNDEELAFVSGLAELAAAAINNAQLLRRLEERNRRLTSLVDASAAITSTVVLEDVLTEVAQQAARALGSPQCLIWEYVAEGDGLVERAYYSEDPEDDFEPREFLTLAQDPVSRDILAGGVAVQESISDPDLHPDSRESMERWGEKTCLSVPLVFHGAPVGMLILCEVDEERDYSRDERELAAALGKAASSAIHNARKSRPSVSARCWTPAGRRPHRWCLRTC
jgi:excisionase family DNA binding protein